MKQNINILLKNMKIKVLKIWKIQRLLLNIENIYKNIEECNQSRKFHALIVFDDMIADVISSKELVQLQPNSLLGDEN